MMDVSVEYILMCNKANEIQVMLPELKRDTLNINQKLSVYESMKMNHLGDGICCDGYSGNWWFIKMKGIPVWNAQENDFVWLPRQDQLQEIYIGKDYKCPQIVLSDFVWWLVDFDKHKDSFADTPYPRSEDFLMRSEFTSMEQLWLAFVMEKKFGKTWERNKWIAKKELGRQ